MSRAVHLLGLGTITLGALILLLELSGPIAYGLLAVLAIACGLTALIDLREREARAEIARIIERTKTR